MSILDKLNEEQRKPAEATEGAVLVTAGAGSGKTRLLTHRIASLVQDKGVKPYQILAITFTNKAANEMKERIRQMVEGGDDMLVSTFHSMCTRFLRRDGNRIGYNSNFSIYGDAERDRILKRFILEKEIDITPQTMSFHISSAKNKLLTPEMYEKYITYDKKADAIIMLYNMYEAELKQSNALDFDDLLMKTYELFIKCPDILEYYQNKFKYIHVDEFQDTNTAQYEIVKLLAGKYGNIFVVGDEDQCIYTWRGAEVGNVQDFTKDFKNVQIFKLEQNYRSTMKILEKANKLIKNNVHRIDKSLWTENSAGTKVEEYVCYNDIEEAEYVASTISSLIEYNGYSCKDFAVLMRVNSQSRIIEEKMLNYQLAHQVYGGFKFFERKEVKDTLAYLRVLANPNDTEALVRTMAFPKKGIGETSVKELYSLAESYGTTMYDLMMSSGKLTDAMTRKMQPLKEILCHLQEKLAQMPLYEFTSYMVEYLKIKETLGSKTDEDITKQMNIDDFVESIKEFTEANVGAELSSYLQSITLMRDSDNMNDKDDYITIMTVHSAKGLEFKVVFVVGLNEGIFPLGRAVKSKSMDEIEEERRLMYVAVTRAKERLYLTRARTRFSFENHCTEYTDESRFLSEMSNREIKEEPDNNCYRSKKESTETTDKKTLLSSAISKGIKATISSASGKEHMYKMTDFKIGTKVKHPHFGIGEVTIPVTDFISSFITIKFETVGIKTLSLKFAPLEIIE
ncbi:MAG: UvrD-helicase domain-containing protein [Clostridia bacterium]